MGSSLPPSSTPSPDFLEVFHAHASADGTMTFAQFMELALYHPQLGYYRRDRPRVGYGQDTDFFTASTSGPLFGELIAAACATLLAGKNLREFTFFEIGAETEGGILTGVAHPFAAVRTLRIGQPLAFSGQCVVFSNELFDAQPFRRFVSRAGNWRELGVSLHKEQLVEIELPAAIADLPPLPVNAPESYVFDAPWAAVELARQISAQPWSGLFLACDYGKSWRELAEAAPQGTARAYRQHRQSNALLHSPGEQDLTCHVCWDWLADALKDRGFESPRIESQEAFFIHHAGEFIARTSQTEAARFSQRKLSLAQLLHPAHLGQKFQVLHALRE